MADASHPLSPLQIMSRTPDFWLAVSAFLTLLTGCGRPDSTAQFQEVPEERRYGGTAVIAVPTDIADINPLTSADIFAADVQQYILFLPGIHYDENFQPIPALARSWELSPDSSELTFHLRNDVYWHDGVKATAYDLWFAYERARDPATAYPNSASIAHYGDGEAIDSFTFRVGLRPHADQMDFWRTFYALPRHVLGDVPPALWRQHAFSSRQPLGNGPFRFVSHLENQSWTFEANEDFPEELGGRPYLDRIVYRSIPEVTTILTELLTGSIDYAIGLPPEQASLVSNAPGVRLTSFSGRSFVFIGWNQRRAPFGDVRVRRAMTLGINRQQILESLVSGRGSLANSPIPAIFWQHDPAAGADLTFDPEAAQTLLAEAGYLKGPDGMLRNAIGQPLAFTLLASQGGQLQADIGAVVQADLRRLGVDMRIQVLEFGSLVGRLTDPVRRGFDAVLIDFFPAFRIDYTDLFHCDKINGPFQIAGHCDRQLDALMDRLSLIADREEAKPLWQEYQRRLADSQPFTLIYFPERLFGISNRLRNVNPDPRGDLVGIDRWYIVPSSAS